MSKIQACFPTPWRSHQLGFLRERSSLKPFKVVLLGDGAVGKSTWLKRLLTAQPCDPKYIATLGVEVHPLSLQTSEGEVVFHIWDTAGQEKFGGLRDGYYMGADVGVIMGDLSNRNTIRNMDEVWRQDFQRVCPEALIVTVVNKTDRNAESAIPEGAYAFSVRQASRGVLEGPLYACLTALETH